MVKREMGLAVFEPRSHSLVVRATGNRVGPFPREFKSLSRRQHHNLHDALPRGVFVDETPLVRRRWWVLFLLGVLLHGIAAVNSDLGLDTHVRLNALADQQREVHDLTWGAPRISGNVSGGTPAEYSGYIIPWNASEFNAVLTSVVAVSLLAFLVCLNPRWSTSRYRFDPIWGALLLLSPVLVFSSSRGYDEGSLAVLMGVGVSGFWFNQGTSVGENRINGLLMATSLVLVAAWKGFSPFTLLLLWLGAAAGLEAWLRFAAHQKNPRIADRLTNPRFMGSLAFALVSMVALLSGFVTNSGTFSTVGEHPGTYLLAFFFAFLNGSLLFLMVGCLLWPHFVSRVRPLMSVSGHGVTLLSMFICGAFAGVTAYTAALWTLESQLWDLSLFKVMLILGNNGRYATVLILPLVLLLRWVEPVAPSPSAKQCVLAVVVVAPFLLFTVLIGHQIWSEDAGETLASNWSSGDDHVHLIASEAMAMHHLYVLKTNIDLDGSLGVRGTWSTADAGPSFLETQLGSVDFVVVGPGIETAMDENMWVLVAEDDVPVTVPGGIQSGHWKLYRYIG